MRQLSVGNAFLNKSKLDCTWPLECRGTLRRWQRDLQSRGCREVVVPTRYKVLGANVLTQDAVGKKAAQEQLNSWVGLGYTIAGDDRASTHLQAIWNHETTSSPWHIDVNDGLLLCLRGAKRVFFIPKTVESTTVAIQDAREGVISQPCPNIQVQDYPVHRGQYVVIPKYYWHRVVSDKDSFAVSYNISSFVATVSYHT